MPRRVCIQEMTAIIDTIGAGPPTALFVYSRSVMTSSNSIRSVFLDGPAGRLEALLNQGVTTTKYAAVVCHPHPLYGGTMHNKVVFHAMKALNGLGMPVLRFNFRGAGLSEGEHDQGRGEMEDVQAALDWLDREFHLPLLFAGFSFGAAVGLRIACPDDRVKAAIGLGLPVGQVDGRQYKFDFLNDCYKPMLFVSGERDQFATVEQLEAMVSSVAGPRKLVIVQGADHFFEGHLPEMRTTVEAWAKEILQVS